MKAASNLRAVTAQSLSDAMGPVGMGGGGGMKAQQRMMSQMQGRQKFGR